MALLNQSVQVYGKIPKFLETLRAGTAPPTFTRQFLKDIDYKSTNDHQFIPLLKGLGFLSENGIPTERYKQFLDGSRWKKVLSESVREAYGDIFVIKAKPSSADLQMITGKFKSTYNQSDTAADRAARTFLALLSLCDTDTLYGTSKSEAADASIDDVAAQPVDQVNIESVVPIIKPKPNTPLGLNYNIQIQLPATKDIEVYNAIFKSLREHIID